VCLHRADFPLPQDQVARPLLDRSGRAVQRHLRRSNQRACHCDGDVHKVCADEGHIVFEVTELASSSKPARAAAPANQKSALTASFAQPCAFAMADSTSSVIVWSCSFLKVTQEGRWQVALRFYSTMPLLLLFMPCSSAVSSASLARTSAPRNRRRLGNSAQGHLGDANLEQTLSANVSRRTKQSCC